MILASIVPTLVLSLALFGFTIGAAGGQAQTALAAPSPAPSLTIESFGPARAYVVGKERVTLVATFRNTGSTPLPPDTITARVYGLAGLDYEGTIFQKLPGLDANSAITLRWQTVSIRTDIPLVASVGLDIPEQPRLVRVVPIQQFDRSPPGDSAGFSPKASARARGVSGVLENERLRARIATTNANVPALFLSVRTDTGWQRMGVMLPLAELMTAEGGQQPWWEVFRAERIQADNQATGASLTLTGGFGLRWRATFDLTLRTGSSVLELRLRCVPLRQVRLSGVRFMPFYAGERSFGAEITEQMPAEVVGQHTLAAMRWNRITFGTLLSNAPLFPDWETVSLPDVTGASYRVLGAEMRALNVPSSMTPASLVEVRGRIFALTPSDSVQDAMRIVMPAKTAPVTKTKP
jgi:hypothetical protein